MSTSPDDNSKPARKEADPQPLALRDLLRALNTTRRQASLYGSDHPSIQQAIDGLLNVITAFLECFGPSTFVIMEEAVILNDRWFQPCNDSRELFRRLRSRGAMAFSLVGEISSNQMLEFLLYLNVEPHEVRREGGSNAYLRKHGITRIVATDTIYSIEDTEAQEEADMPTMDRAVSAVVTWLTRQDEEQDLPRFRTTEIFSNPDAAARLIHEAVTKLHASNRSKRPSELAGKVVDDLKDLASANHDDWDKSTPKIRKAISKLPKEMRPSFGGFSSCDQDVEAGGSATCHGTADASEVESAVNDFLETASGFGEGNSDARLPDVEKLFGAACSGLLSNWKTELQPLMTMRSSAHTLSMLMAWETNSSEHGEMSRSQATLITAYSKAGEPQLALESAASLVEEIRQIDKPAWRAINAKTALQAVDITILSDLVQYSLKSGDQRAQDIAASMVEGLPNLALAVLENLKDGSNGRFMQHLQAGIKKCGRMAGPVLGQLMTEGSSAKRWTALEMLISIGTDWALFEMDAGLTNTEPAFLARALEAISHVRSPLMTQICLANLKHKSPTVRCAALSALGSVGDASVIPDLMRFAGRSAYLARHLDEKIAAIGSLGKLGEPELIKWLERIAAGRSLFWRTKHQLLRTSAAQAVEEIRSRPTAHRNAA